MKAKLRSVWRHMLDRCYDESHRSYPFYGAKGIVVCEEWKSFDVFFQWAESRYLQGFQLDREDSAKNYEPSNCRFVTPTQNARNRSNVKLNPDSAMDIRNALREGVGIRTLARKYGVNPGTIYRIKTGENWSQP